MVTTAKTLVAVETILDVARAQPIRASHGQIQVTAITAITAVAASVAHKARARYAMTSNRAHRVTKFSARTHAARVLTWASSATTLTNASQPAMCQQAFHHQACQRAAAVVEEAVTVVLVVEAIAAVVAAAVAAVVTGAAVVRVQVAAAVGATRAVGFNASRPKACQGQKGIIKKSARGCFFYLFLQAFLVSSPCKMRAISY